jgi:hypothetical protein
MSDADDSVVITSDARTVEEAAHDIADAFGDDDVVWSAGWCRPRTTTSC